MKEFFLLIAIIFFHILEDFHLQGILASLKQKDWWAEHYPDKLYKDDYVAALIAHSFSWSFMVHLPGFVYMYIMNKQIPLLFLIISFIWHIIWHAITDNDKANKHTISLVDDQLVHLIQIIGIWVMFSTFAN